MMTSTQLSNQEPYLTIHADGRITVSEKLQPSETAARVLECIKTQWMEDSQSKQIRELQERIKRLEEAGDVIKASLQRSLNSNEQGECKWLAELPMTDAEFAVFTTAFKAKETKP